jgi:hypothetical protein
MRFFAILSFLSFSLFGLNVCRCVRLCACLPFKLLEHFLFVAYLETLRKVDLKASKQEGTARPRPLVRQQQKKEKSPLRILKSPKKCANLVFLFSFACVVVFASVGK